MRKAIQITDNFKFVHQYGEDVINLLEVKEGMRILDLGCGNGALTKKIADMGADVNGMDASQDMLENVSKVLKTGGYMVCEFGGYGCAETIHSALRSAFERRGIKYNHGFYFPTIGEYTPILERHQLKTVYASSIHWQMKSEKKPYRI